MCSQEALGRPGPHPLFVDQARATLVQLDADDVHMSSCCHDRWVCEAGSGGGGGREGSQLDADDIHMSSCCHDR